MKATTGKSVLLRCGNCGAVNRVPSEKLSEGPKCGRCKAFIEFPKTAVEVTDSNFDKAVLGNPGTTLVFFWAQWCGYCKGMIPMLQDIARQRAGQLEVGMVNTEKAPLLARRFTVMSVPRIMLYRNGRLLNELNGAVQRGRLEQWLDSWSGIDNS